VKKPTSAFIGALKKTYALRSKLFFKRIESQNPRKWRATVEGIDGSSLQWDLDQLGIQRSAAEKVKNAGTPYHYVFCHPDVLRSHPELEEYYRNLTALSRKGFNQLFAGQKVVGDERRNMIARAFNEILSEAMEAWPKFSPDLLRDVICAELGTEIQGTWVNLIGKGAAKVVETMLEDFAKQKDFVKQVLVEKVKIEGKLRSRRSIVLKNGWRIVFSPEPDVGVYDPKGVIRVAIEIKGSMDKAGAQTRYGEAKKSFGKALKANPRCETIYLGSVFTDAVNQQIEANGQVRKTFDLVDILADERAKNALLDEIFKYQIRLNY
jgi:hypothetical protein